MKQGRIPFPREHGGWAIFLVPLVIGTAAGGKWDGSLVLFLIAALFAFLARAPLGGLLQSPPAAGDSGAWRRRLWTWFGVYGGISLLALFPLLTFYRRPFLLLFGAAGVVLLYLHLRAVLHRRERTLVSQVLAAMGLSLSAPAAYYVAAGILDSRALVLWVVNAAFFSSEVCYVQMRVQAQRFHRPSFRGTAASAYVGTLSVVVVFCLLGLLPAAFLLPFVPSFLKVIWVSIRTPRRLLIRRLGWLGVVHSAGFIVLCLLSWNLVYRGF